MKQIQGQHSDILAKLSGKAGVAKGSNKAAAAAGDGVDLLAMLSSDINANAAQKNEFAQILSEKGMLEDISSEDLLNFFKKSNGQNSEGQGVSELLNAYSQLTGKNINLEGLPDGLKSEISELTFDGKDFTNTEGEVVPKNKVIKLLSELSTKNTDTKTKLATDFSQDLKTAKLDPALKNNILKGNKVQDKALPKTNSADFLQHRMAVTKKNPQAAISQPGLNKYNKEAAGMNQSLIQQSQPKKKMEVGKSEKINSSSSMEDLLESISGENQNDHLNVSNLKGKAANNQEFNMGKGQVSQTLDLSSISAGNKAELMQKVGNYIEQSYVSGRESVDMMIHHDELGQFRVQVQKVGNSGKLDLEINALTDQGHKFFAENESELLKSLNKSGIKLNDFKLSPQMDFLSMGESSKSSMNSDSSSSFLGGNNRGEASAFTQGGKQGDNRGEDRRRQLWQEAKSFSEQMYA